MPQCSRYAYGHRAHTQRCFAAVLAATPPRRHRRRRRRQSYRQRHQRHTNATTMLSAAAPRDGEPLRRRKTPIRVNPANARVTGSYLVTLCDDTSRTLKEFTDYVKDLDGDDGNPTWHAHVKYELQHNSTRAIRASTSKRALDGEILLSNPLICLRGVTEDAVNDILSLEVRMPPDATSAPVRQLSSSAANHPTISSRSPTDAIPKQNSPISQPPTPLTRHR